MTNKEIGLRCLREIRASKNRPMLTVAWKYSRLFIAYLFRRGIPVSTIRTVDNHIIKVYKKRKEELR